VSDGERREREILRPRIGGRGGEVPQERVPRFRNRLLARVARMGGASGGPSSRPRGTASARDVPRPGPSARRCVIKARYVPMNAYGKRAAALHLSYVERDGVEQDGGAGSLYGPAEASDVRVALGAPMEDEKRQFRFIVSPEDGAETDLTAFTRRLMAQVQADLGRVLIWGAVNHWNTESPHVHVIVRGIDEAGRDVTIDGRYLAEGMRSRAQAILTNELGPRTEVEAQRQLEREVRQQRFTSLDRVLQSCEQPGGALMEPRLPREGRVSRARLVARLGHLAQLGLAVRTSPTAWALREGWAETLRGLGQAKDIIKRMSAAVPTPDPSRFVVLDESSTLAPVDGVVRGKGLHDELAGRPYAVVESVDGRVFYTPVDVTTAEKVRDGDIVRLAIEPPKNVAAGGESVQPGRPRVRLQRLAPPLREQVDYRGPTWLDAVGRGGPASAAGRLALEITESLARRDAGLRATGIDVGDRARLMARLGALEAKALGSRLAGELACVLTTSPVGLQGTLTLAPRLQSGRQYAIVTDERSKRFWVLPASRQLRLLAGQNVEGDLAPDGRLVVSRSGLGRRRLGPER
jgi:type IV secretory pathway VirD2 relaxase